MTKIMSSHYRNHYARIILILHSTGVRFSMCAKPYGVANYYSQTVYVIICAMYMANQYNKFHRTTFSLNMPPILILKIHIWSWNNSVWYSDWAGAG
jgi:lipoprotein signal peptidase